MRCLPRLLTAVVVLAAVAGTAHPGQADKTTKETGKTTKRKAKTTRKEPKAKPAPKAAKVKSFTDNQAKMKALALSEEQQAQLKEAIEARDAALEKWGQINERSLAAARERVAKAKGKSVTGARKRLDALTKNVNLGRDRIAAQHERKMFAILTAEQRGQWNGPVLAADVNKEFSSVKLDAEQKQKILALCQERGQRITEPASAGKNTGIVKAITSQVYSRVLTPEQRKTYNERKRATVKKPTPKRTTRKKTTRK